MNIDAGTSNNQKRSFERHQLNRNNSHSIAIVANTDWAVFNFRSGLIKKLRESAVQVTCVCSDTGFWNYLNRLNITSLVRTRKYVKQINPVKDTRLFLEYYQLYHSLKPDIAHHFTIKPVIYGSLAARMANVPVIVNTITGLGYIFTGGQANRLCLKRLTCGLYRLSASVSDYLWFQNEQDRGFFVKRKIVHRNKCGVVFGSGVDTDYFSSDKVTYDKIHALRKDLKLEKLDAVVIMVARMLYDKGVREFIEAGRNIIKRIRGVKFILVGPLAPGNPSMIPYNQINQWVEEGVVQYLGRRLDIRELMCMAEMVVLPSYREGIPKSILEAAAMGKPIITTDTVGCREVVNNGENGLLVPVKNSIALQEAIEKLLLNPELRTVMGKKSRQRAIKEFDEKKVIAQTLVMYKKLLARRRIKVGLRVAHK